MFNEMMQNLSAFLAENPLTDLLSLSYYSFPVVEVIHVADLRHFFWRHDDAGLSFIGQLAASSPVSKPCAIS